MSDTENSQQRKSLSTGVGLIASAFGVSIIGLTLTDAMEITAQTELAALILTALIAWGIAGVGGCELMHTLTTDNE